jgi:DNA polymerase III epsilon subunit-like protein
VAVLDTEKRRIESSFSFIAKPDGFSIPDEAAAIHGITTEIDIDYYNFIQARLA